MLAVCTTEDSGTPKARAVTISMGGMANRSIVLTNAVACSSRSDPRAGPLI